MSSPREDLGAAYLLAAGVELGPDNQPRGGEGALIPKPPEPGRWDRRVLLQDKYWWDIEARRHAIEDMDQAYRSNVLSWLEQLEPEIARYARLWIDVDLLNEDFTANEHRRQRRLLRLLEPGWTSRTPLGRALAKPHGSSC